MNLRNGPGNGLDLPDATDEHRAYAALSLIGFGDQPLVGTLQQVTDLAKQALPEHPEVSVTLLKDDEPTTAAFTADVAIQLDERQYDRGFGPCLDAASSGSTVGLTMSDPHNPYPEFARLAQSLGVTHSLSLGLPVATRTLGALNIYASTGRPFSSEASRIAGTFAGFAGMLLANVVGYHDAVELASQVQEAMRSRAVIEQAKGILMDRNRCSSEQAFTLLSKASQRQNVKLRILAQALVDEAVGREPGPR